ncbi:protein LLP-like protein [Leptotrombidium deliense]|uniref:Protein LLP-like protein n=1 Tax=Leptotrombidium deliense TaxID=299467 RepID=A0A443SBG1_9ACAR|nr:protein LLP-like protein [Leptotrombidium deliense]
MAKSLRSKWKRKMKAIKRERYAVKELDALKKIVAKAAAGETLTDVNIVKPVKTNENLMQVEEKVEKRNSRTLKNEHGNYPVWMNQRKISKLKKRNRKLKKSA